MLIKHAASAVLSTVAIMALSPLAAYAAPPTTQAGVFQTITRDGVSIKYQRVVKTGSPGTGAGETRSDYDGDGLDDIAAASSGGVIVRYSSKRWVDYFANLTGGEIPYTFGAALTSGDFNADGYDDLVIGDRDEMDPAAANVSAGGLWIVPGSAQGLAVSAIRHLNQSSAGVPGASGGGDEFAAALAAGDINGDGRADLAVGLPGEAKGTISQAGAMIMFLSNANGVSTTGARWLDQNADYMPDTAEQWDRFGSALAIGKWNADPYGDLVIGSAGESTGTVSRPSKGLVNLILGVSTGLNVIGVASVYGDDFDSADVDLVRLGYGGFALADTNGDKRDDLLIGVPEATVAGQAHAGAVVSLLGQDGGFTGGDVITQNTAGVAGQAESGDGFGTSVAAGDMNNDGLADVIVGVPYEDVENPPQGARGTVSNAGVITLLDGSATGPVGSPSGELSQGYEYTPGISQKNDYFGARVSVRNLDGREGLDAAVSAQGEFGNDDHSNPGPGTGTTGAITTYLGDFRFMHGEGRTVSRDVAIPGFSATIYGYVL